MVQTKNSANKGFVRRFYDTRTTDISTTNAVIAAYSIAKMDTVVILPIVPSGSVDVTLQIEVSYDEPRYDVDGDFADAEDLTGGDDDGVFIWRPFKTQVVSATSTTPDDDKTVISQFNTGISAIRISGQATAASQVTTYLRGYHIQR